MNSRMHPFGFVPVDAREKSDPERLAASLGAGEQIARQLAGQALHVKARTMVGDQECAPRSAKAPFPLTPTLSLGERETSISRCSQSVRVRFGKRQPRIPPLPQGEGRGEGKGRLLHLEMWPSSLNRQTVRVPWQSRGAPWPTAPWIAFGSPQVKNLLWKVDGIHFLGTESLIAQPLWGRPVQFNFVRHLHRCVHSSANEDDTNLHYVNRFKDDFHLASFSGWISR